MKKETLQEAGKIAVLFLTFLIGFVCLFLIPDDSHSETKWFLLLITSKLISAAGFYAFYRLNKRWEDTGWIKKHKDWIEEADRMPNHLNRGDDE